MYHIPPEKTTLSLNYAIDVVVIKKNELEMAKAEVTKCGHNKTLIEEQIKCEKKFIDAGK